MDIWQQIVIPLVTAAIGWAFAKLKTGRERKQSDLELINGAVSPLLESIRDLTNHGNNITEKLLQEQTKNLELMERNAALLTERIDLVKKLGKLEREVATLTKEIKKLTAEKDQGTTPEQEIKHE